jgi:hypothetical protein
LSAKEKYPAIETLESEDDKIGTNNVCTKMFLFDLSGNNTSIRGNQI